MEAIDRIAPSSVQYKKLSSIDVQVLLNRWQMQFERKKRFDDFDNPQSLSDDDYQMLTGLSKSQFDDLISQVSTSNIRNSNYRSIRTVIAILLCKLRLGLSNNMLAILFELSDRRAISRALESARRALMSSVVPYNLGFNHVTRREIIDQYTSTISRQLMCDDESNRAIIVADSTYIFIQVNNSSSLRILFFSFERNPETIVSKENHIIFIRNDHY